jgi:UDP-2,3-diacylglucosamine pyrophosphatase LpxH
VKYRTIFTSDWHLGGSCNYSALLNFIKQNDADVWYIVGDFLGLWEVARSHSWPAEANEILRALIKKARTSKIIILYGNHDAALRHFVSLELGNITVTDKTIFQALGGQRFLVLHGDIFDPIVTGHAKWLAHVGSALYDYLVVLNMSLNWIRKALGVKFWSFSAAIKQSVKQAVSYVGDFEESVIEMAKQDGLQGAVVGHIHCAALKEINGLLYINCGDFVESLTFVAEHVDGKLELIYYDEH